MCVERVSGGVALSSIFALNWRNFVDIRPVSCRYLAGIKVALKASPGCWALSSQRQRSPTNVAMTPY